MSRIFLLLVITALSAAGNEERQAEKNTNIKNNLQKLREVVKEKLSPMTSSRKSKDLEPENLRKAKNYGYYPYMPNPTYIPTNYKYPNDLGYYYPQGKTPLPQEWRTEPFKRKTTPQLYDSPIYLVRLPPNPYEYIPGVGYVSRPPSLNDPGLLNSLAEAKPESSTSPGEISTNDFIQVPIDFISNGKPTSVYQLPNDPIKQKPDSNIYNLDKGPYLFNGKPIELYVLRNSYNQMYAEALTNFYP